MSTDAASLVSAIVDPLSSYLSPRSLARLAGSCTAVHAALRHADACWVAAASHAGLPARSYADLVSYYRSHCLFCCDVSFGATVERGGKRLILDLGSAEPSTRRVAAAHSIVSLSRFGSVDFHIRELSHEPNHHVILWLGVLFDKRDGCILDGGTQDAALSAYDVSRATMGERFSRGQWSMNAIGSSGAVWSDTSVVRMLGKRFGCGDTVRIILDGDKGELRVRLTSGDGQRSTEHVAVRRLVSRAISSAGQSRRMHAIAHLTDVAIPAIGRSARAIIDVGE